MADNYLAALACEAAALPSVWAERLHGETLEELVADAERVAWGAPRQRTQDERGPARRPARRSAPGVQRAGGSGAHRSRERRDHHTRACRSPRPRAAASSTLAIAAAPYDDAPRSMDAFRDLARRDPERANDMVERGIVDLRTLPKH